MPPQCRGNRSKYSLPAELPSLSSKPLPEYDFSLFEFQYDNLMSSTSLNRFLDHDTTCVECQSNSPMEYEPYRTASESSNPTLSPNIETPAPSPDKSRHTLPSPIHTSATSPGFSASPPNNVQQLHSPISLRSSTPSFEAFKLFSYEEITPTSAALSSFFHDGVALLIPCLHKYSLRSVLMQLELDPIKIFCKECGIEVIGVQADSPVGNGSSWDVDTMWPAITLLNMSNEGIVDISEPVVTGGMEEGGTQKMEHESIVTGGDGVLQKVSDEHDTIEEVAGHIIDVKERYAPKFGAED